MVVFARYSCLHLWTGCRHDDGMVVMFHLYRGRRDSSHDGCFDICIEAVVTVIL